jgi:hypothetical protein
MEHIKFVYNVLTFVNILCEHKGAGVALSPEELGSLLDDEGMVCRFCVIP